MTDNALSWLDNMLQQHKHEALEAEQREARRVLRDVERRAVLKSYSPPFKDPYRETEYQWHTCRMRRATVTWLP